MPSKLATINLYKKRLLALIKHPFFWVLTVAGNSVIGFGSYLLYYFENLNQTVKVSYLDCVLWATGLVTTIGYGDFVPQTTSAKIVVLILMLSGTLFVWSYMAFLVTGLIAPELNSLEKDVHEVEKEVLELKKGTTDVPVS